MKLPPKSDTDHVPLPSGERSPKSAKIPADAGNLAAKKPKGGAANLKHTGRPKGSKNKTTKLIEAAKRATAEILATQKVTPLEVMLGFMEEAAREHVIAKQAWALESKLPPPDDKDLAGKEARRALRDSVGKTRNVAMDCAIAAAPYCHSKLQSVDKTVKKGVLITVKQYQLTDSRKKA